MARQKTKDNDSLSISKTEYNNRIKEKIGNIILNDTKVDAKNDSQKELIKSIKDNQITICSGHPGSGKTFLSLAYALSLLKKKGNQYQKIYLVKSVTQLKGEEVGYLKGGIEEKFEPYLWSFRLNIEKLNIGSDPKSLFEADLVRPLPLAFIKGTSISNAIIIADEFQNVSIENARNLLTRVEDTSKLILIGDTNQIDLKNKKYSSLEPLMEKFRGVDQIGTIRMNPDDDNIRNPLIKIIEEKFQELMDEESKIKNNGKQVLHG